MTLETRRIVTGHDDNGKAIVASDERMTGGSAPGRPGIARVELWSTDKMPVDNSEGGPRRRSARALSCATITSARARAHVCRVVEFEPGGTKFMHRTETLDYAILLSGECDLELDDGKTVHMKQGDIVVQRGTMHAWVPTGSAPAVFAFILIDADPVTAGGQKLTTHYPVR